MNGEQAAAQHAIAGEARQRRLRHRGYIEDVEVGSAEVDGRPFSHRHVDDLVDLAIRRIADDLSVIDLRVPEIAFRIDGRAIGGTALRCIELDEGAAVLHRAGIDVIVIGPNFPGPAIGEVEDLVVRTPAGTIGNTFSSFSTIT